MAQKKKKTSNRSSKKEEKKEKKELTPQQKQKMKGGILMLIGFATLLFVGYFLFGKFFSPQPVAELLPADRTIALLEVNIDGNHGQVKQFHELMDGYAVYQPQGIIAAINTVLPVDYETELEPWLGRNMGLALLQSDENGPFTPLLFVETRDHAATIDFMQNRGLSTAGEELRATEYEGFRIYDFTMTQSISFTFINNYLVVADSQDVLGALIDDFRQRPRLSDDTDYRKVANNLPHGGLAFGYIHLSKLFQTLERDELFVVQKGQDLLALRPFLNVFKGDGISLFAEDDRFVGQTFTSINTEALGGDSYLTFAQPYTGDLLKLLGEEPLFLAAGHDLTSELNRMEEIFKSGTKTPALVFDGLLEAQKQRFFGTEIGLKEHLYPLFTGEYLVAVENSLANPTVSVVLELQDNVGSVSRFDKVVSEFIKVSGVFSPQVVEIELPDGTIGKEIVASPEKVARQSGTYQGHTITTLRLGNTGISIHYAILNTTLIMSTNGTTLQHMIDRYDGRLEDGLTASRSYDRNIRPALRTADQLLHLKLGALTQLLELNEDSVMAPYLIPLKNLTVAKNFFDDGISTTYFIEVL